ncbi:hypothetical protein [Nocardia sp. NPDC051570]|uniref:hypothetical protein n=1 Tax=Nocardia sp. NPDC051570 TaxID=3364324 RepID=UPI0037B1DF03
MRRTAIAISLLVTAASLAGCGSSGGQESHSANGSATTSAAAAPGAAPAGGKCTTQQWPQPMPDLQGKPLGATVVGAALCYDITEVTAPDGSDVRQDPKALTTPWTITEQSPAPGTPVAATTPVTLKVEAAQHN